MYPHPQIWRPLALSSALVAATMFATSTITVAPGDTLSELAEQHDATVADLLAWNGLDDPDRVYAGSTLIVSAPDDAAPAAAGNGTHLVTAGDTLSAIASRFSLSIRSIVDANGLDDPDRIYVGQSLVLGEGAAPATSTATGTTHTVVAGDTLSTIAERYRVKTGVLAADNGITDADHIVIGMVLTIGEPAPATAATTTTKPTTPTTTAPASPTTPTTTAAPATPTSTTAPPPASSGSPRSGGDVLLVPMFNRWAGAYGVPQDLVEAIAWKESNWAPTAVSTGGHLGIMQLSPDTVALVEGGLLGRDMDPLDANDGIQMGARYLRYLLDRTDSERSAVAAWRQGLQSVEGNGVTDAGAAYADSIEEIRVQRS